MKVSSPEQSKKKKNFCLTCNLAIVRKWKFPIFYDRNRIICMSCILWVVRNFLDIQKAKTYNEIVNYMIEKFSFLSVNMIIKVHFFHIHLGQFPENLGHVSTKQRKYFTRPLELELELETTC